ncbi:MAG: hypothetical protein N2255_00815 [Kiritimatiellae bacterium]|nr:hypothetical protein [Kiritimatiellia bacterium]
MNRATLQKVAVVGLLGVVLVGGCGRCSGRRPQERERTEVPAPPVAPEVASRPGEAKTNQPVPRVTARSSRDTTVSTQMPVRQPGGASSIAPDTRKPVVAPKVPRKPTPPEDK